MESHFTATGLVVDKTRSKALMILHKKLNVWLPAGGHVEPGELPHETVVREVFEETGVRARIIDASNNLCLSNTREIQICAPRWVLHEPIPAHGQKPAHWHYDFIYCLEAENTEFVHNEHETHGINWFDAPQLATCDTTQATRAMYLLLLGSAR